MTQCLKFEKSCFYTGCQIYLTFTVVSKSQQTMTLHTIKRSEL